MSQKDRLLRLSALEVKKDSLATNKVSHALFMPEHAINLEILPVPIVCDHIPRRALRHNSTTIIHSIYAHMIAPEIHTKLADFNIMLSQNQTFFFSPNLIAI